mmetsp:Transcript_14832/g.27446  ORF Transcript_14832/g.27446 Transcript_14832/m.27446 type:complete len:350 (-) Transcript_14832:237-1286(-)
MLPSLFFLLIVLTAAQISTYELTIASKSFERISRSTVFSKEDFEGENDPFIHLSAKQATDNIDFLLFSSQNYRALKQEYSPEALAGILCEEISYRNDSVSDIRSYITETDAYYTFVVNCNEHEVNATVVQEVLNPYGYIPADEAYMLKFHIMCLVAYVILLAVWTGLLVYYRWATVPIQKVIFPLVIILNIVAHCLLIANWLYANQTGDRSVVWVLGMLMFGALRSAISWFLFLVVSKGWGVSRKTLGLTAIKLLLASILYYPSLLFYNLFLYLRSQDQTDFTTLTFVSIPVIILTFILYLWTFKALAHERSKLDSLRMNHKVKIYDQMVHLSIVIFACQACWYVIEKY